MPLLLIVSKVIWLFKKLMNIFSEAEDFFWTSEMLKFYIIFLYFIFLQKYLFNFPCVLLCSWVNKPCVCIKLHVMLMLKTCKLNLSTSVRIASGSGAELNGIIRIMALFYRTSWKSLLFSQETTNIYAVAWRGCRVYSAHGTLFTQNPRRSQVCSSHHTQKCHIMSR